MLDCVFGTELLSLTKRANKGQEQEKVRAMRQFQCSELLVGDTKK
jgi:hypothetical protein